MQRHPSMRAPELARSFLECSSYKENDGQLSIQPVNDTERGLVDIPVEGNGLGAVSMAA